jgi:hypothetical protein
MLKIRPKLKLVPIALLSIVLTGSMLVTDFPAVRAVESTMSTYSWDPGLYATASTYFDEAHAWGQRKTAGAWGTGSVNYQAGDTVTNTAASSGTLSVVLNGTYCPGGVCSYGSGTGYKGLVQFWNDPSNYIAFGLIHDPRVSPTGTTLMVEGAANGKPVGGYWGSNGITGTSHLFTFNWTATGISVTIDNQVTLGVYPVTETHPSISFLAAARNTGDICDTTFTDISFSPGSVVAEPVTIPSGSPYFTYTTTLSESGSGSGYSAYINAHDADDNAISVGVQTDSSSPESNGQPYYIWERVQGGQFTYDYLGPASNGSVPITLKWWQNSDTAVLYEGSTPVADIAVNLVPQLFFSVEGDGRQNGVTVNDTFNNVQISDGLVCPSYCGLTGSWNTSSFNFYGLKATDTNGQSQNGANFTVTGTVSGLPSTGTWDTNEVAGIGMIAQNWGN